MLRNREWAQARAGDRRGARLCREVGSSRSRGLTGSPSGWDEGAMRGPLAALVLAASLAPPAAVALEVEEVEQGAPGAEGEDGEGAIAEAVAVAPGDEPARVTATALGGAGGPAGAATPAGDGGSAGLGRVYGASGGGEVAVVGSAVGGAGGARSDALPGGDGASVRLENAGDGDTRGELSLGQSAHGGIPGGAGGRPGDAESILERSKRAEVLVLFSGAVAGGAPADFTEPDTSPPDLAAPGGDAAASVRGSNRGGSTAVLGLAHAGPGGIRPGDEAGFDGGDAEVFAVGSTRCSGCAVQVGAPSPPRYAPRPLDSPGRVGFAFPTSGALAGAGGGRILPFTFSDVGGKGGRATSLSIGRAHRDAPVTVFDVARGAAGGPSVARVEAARGGDAESIALGIGRGRSPVEVHADAEGGTVGSARVTLGAPPGPGVRGGNAIARAEAEGRGRVVADARAAAGASQTGAAPGASAEARAFAVGR